MKNAYPFQALMAFAALGLLIGLPSLERTRDTLSFLPHSASCLTNRSQTENTDKAETNMSLARAVTGTPVQSAISNTVPDEQPLLDTNMRQTLRQCV